MYLASFPGRRTIAEIAQYYAISQTHVAKVVTRLSQQGFVRSLRGVHGGVELARPAHEITIADVIVANEGGLHLLDCVAVPGVCVIQPGCRLKHVLQEAERRQLEYLREVRLSDVLPLPAPEPPAVVPLHMPSTPSS
ncbi:MAG: hypothetical protein KatS3mg113_1135 [Planctomycetaceae bacterium]|nr:MAG: hypothetical protein KatS3mg113_1135 [Planctomycetaceae bacterium]